MSRMYRMSIECVESLFLVRVESVRVRACTFVCLVFTIPPLRILRVLRDGNTQRKTVYSQSSRYVD